MYRFQVYDLSGSGGLSDNVDSALVADAHWSPASGRLQHGHTYAWTVDGEEMQDWATFVVDLQGSGRQRFDRAGPFSVGLSTGELRAQVEVGPGLAVSYRSTDREGRATGATPTSLTDGWRLEGALVGGAPFSRLQAYGGDDSVMVAYGMDGSAIRYTRNDQDVYLPPSIDDESDLSRTLPRLAKVPGGHFVITELDGGVSTFGVTDELVSYTRPPIAGADTSVALQVTWEGARLRKVHDAVTGDTAVFSYFSERECDNSWNEGSHPTYPLCRCATTIRSTTRKSSTRTIPVQRQLCVPQRGAQTDHFRWRGDPGLCLRRVRAAESRPRGLCGRRGRLGDALER